MSQRVPLAGALIVAVLAGQVELSQPLLPKRLALGAQRRQFGVVRRRQRQPARLPADIGAQRQQVRVLVGPCRRLLVALTAAHDAACQVDRLAAGSVPGRITGSDTRHRLAGIAVAVSAGGGGGASRRAPKRCAVLDPEHRRVLAVVALQRLQRRAHEVQARAARVCGVSWCCDGRGQRGPQQQCRAPGLGAHVGLTALVSRCTKPLSPNHSKASVPGASARTQKDR